MFTLLYIYATDRERLLAGPVLNISSLFHPRQNGASTNGSLKIISLFSSAFSLLANLVFEHQKQEKTDVSNQRLPSED